MFAVLKREFLQVVRKKSFLILTVLMPVFLLALMVGPPLLMARGLSGKRVAVLDATGRLRGAFEAAEAPTPAGQQSTRSVLGSRARRDSLRIAFEYVPIEGDPDRAKAPYVERLTARRIPKERRLEGVVIVPADAFDNRDAKVTLYTRSAADFVTQERLSRVMNSAVTRERLVARGIAPDETDGLLARVSVDSVQLSRGGRERKGGELNFLAAFVFAALLLIPMFIYGQEIMRGIVQEKTDRVVEILISSMSPMQLLSGKILGLAAAGLTQVAIWLSMGAGLAVWAGAAASAAGISVLGAVDPRIVPLFVVFYLLGYLTYASVYAIGGSVTNSEKEAQQFVAPIMFFLLIPWFLATVILQSPESPTAVVLSLIPIFTPITMFMRVLVSDPPAWEVGLSIVLSAATIYGLFWVTAKIFRTGILSYGKRPTIPELWRWLKVA
jgi:ABC-2 type transport system permease protein